MFKLKDLKKNRIWREISRWHKYLGWVLGVLMVVWFLSGFVMIFEGFPKFTDQERLEESPAINNAISKNLDQFLQNKSFVKAEIYHSGGRNILKLWQSDENFQLFGLDNLKRIHRIDSLEAASIALENMGEFNRFTYDKILALDQWIPWQRIEKDLPIHKFYFKDDLHTELYVSSTSGLIVQKQNSYERFWAYLGAIPHYLYFKELRVRRELWVAVVVLLSGAASIMVFLGIAIGIKRLRFKKGKSVIPYRKMFFKWHHITGIVFGLFVFTWSLSGMFSLTRINLTHDEQFITKMKDAWSEQKPIKTPAVYNNLLMIIQAQSPKRIELKQSFDGLMVISETAFEKAIYIDAVKQNPEVQTKKLMKRAKDVFNGKLSAISLMYNYNDYYYSKNNFYPLPVIKAEFNDIDRTTFYIDPADGRIHKSVNNTSRLSRWLYKALHTFDIGILLQNNNIRILLLIVFLIGGTVVSVTGMLFLTKWRNK